jgi:hypothetical protein
LCNAELWYLVSPTTESSLSIEVTFAGKTTNATGFALSLLGTSTGAPLQDVVVATGSNSDPTGTVAGAVTGSMTIGMAIITEATPANLSVSVGTELEEIDLGGETSSIAYIADTGTLTWAHTTDDENWVVAIANYSEPLTATAGFLAVLKETASETAGFLAAFKETASNTAAYQAMLRMVTSATAAAQSVLKGTLAQTAAGRAVLKETASDSAAAQARLEDIVIAGIRGLGSMMYGAASADSAR